MSKIAVAWVTLSLSVGCGAGLNFGSQVYVTQRVVMDTEPDATFVAVKRFVQEHGWTLTAESARAGYIEALSPSERLAELETRERWTFRINDSELAVTRELQANFDAGWAASEFICDGYEYAAEQQALNAIIDSLGDGPQLATLTR
ncbi:MAG: hypothetical protein AAFU77_10265 [Myxococcota bacterium]